MSPVYGLAECSVGLAFTPPGEPWQVDLARPRRFLEQRRRGAGARRRSGAAQGGRAAGARSRTTTCAWSTPPGIELPDRAEGSLQFRGPSATSGYYRNPEATKGLFDGDWVNTGDRAYLSDGTLYLTGREKDIIIRGGRNISPYELEEAVGDIPGVRRGCVAVFGSQDSASGTERIVVLAETRERRGDGDDDIKRMINDLAREPDRRAGRRHRARAAAHRAEDLERQDPPRRGARLLRARPATRCGRRRCGCSSCACCGGRRAAGAPRLARGARHGLRARAYAAFMRHARCRSSPRR